MKRLLLFCFILICFEGLTAQSSYIPFPYSYIIYGFTQSDDIFIGTTAPRIFRTEVTGDTIIAGKHYAAIYLGDGPFIFDGGIRNDTLNKKVYRYYVSLGVEVMLYDFNLSIGDTVNSHSGYGFFPPLAPYSSYYNLPQPDTAWVISIDSVVTPHDGLYHRRFNFAAKILFSRLTVYSENSGPYFDTATSSNIYIMVHSLIEGVGQPSNPVDFYEASPSGDHFRQNLYVGCESVNGITYFNNPSFPFINHSLCNSAPLNINENEFPESDIYPNPTEGMLHVLSHQQIKSISIKDILDKEVLKKEINDNTSEIDLSAYDPGIYFILISDTKGNLLIKKIIKQ